MYLNTIAKQTKRNQLAYFCTSHNTWLVYIASVCNVDRLNVKSNATFANSYFFFDTHLGRSYRYVSKVHYYDYY